MKGQSCQQCQSRVKVFDKVRAGQNRDLGGFCLNGMLISNVSKGSRSLLMSELVSNVSEGLRSLIRSEVIFFLEMLWVMH